VFLPPTGPAESQQFGHRTQGFEECASTESSARRVEQDSVRVHGHNHGDAGRGHRVGSGVRDPRFDPQGSDLLRSVNGTASKCKTFLATATEECCPAIGTLAGHFTRRLSPSPQFYRRLLRGQYSRDRNAPFRLTLVKLEGVRTFRSSRACSRRRLCLQGWAGRDSRFLRNTNSTPKLKDRRRRFWESLALRLGKVGKAASIRIILRDTSGLAWPFAGAIRFRRVRPMW